MEISKGEVLRQALEKVKERTGLDDTSIKQLFIKNYLLGEEEKDPDKLFGEMLHGKKEEPEEE